MTVTTHRIIMQCDKGFDAILQINLQNIKEMQLKVKYEYNDYFINIRVEGYSQSLDWQFY